MATFASASAALKWRPLVSVASLSGPSLPAVAMSVPCTVKETGCGSVLPGLPMFAGMFSCRSLSDSPPVAAVTWPSRAISATVARAQRAAGVAAEVVDALGARMALAVVRRPARRPGPW